MSSILFDPITQRESALDFALPFSLINMCVSLVFESPCAGSFGVIHLIRGVCFRLMSLVNALAYSLNAFQ